MFELRADPWRPDYGAGAEAPFEDHMSSAVVDPAVESGDWSRPIEPAPCPPDASVFVDGVMRTELRVLASDGERRSWGLLGSVAAGAVLCNGKAGFIAEDRPVERVLLIGGRVEGAPLAVDVAGHRLLYDCSPVADDTPTGLRRGLQRLMLGAEQRLAAELTDHGVVFADGPLHPESGPNPGANPVVGVVKRMVSAYLDEPEASLLPHLRPRQRSPLFALGNGVVDRYAWYLRLLEGPSSWHELAGLVRCEVRMSLGLERASALADAVACHLPRFAGRPGVDPRAPQNLTPVGALEARLKHRLGSATLIGRSLLAKLSEEAGGP